MNPEDGSDVSLYECVRAEQASASKEKAGNDANSAVILITTLCRRELLQDLFAGVAVEVQA